MSTPYGSYFYVLKQTMANGQRWQSEVKEGDFRQVCQEVIAGLSGVDGGCVRWAETAPGSLNPYFFLYGVDRRGRGSDQPGFSSADFPND